MNIPANFFNTNPHLGWPINVVDSLANIPFHKLENYPLSAELCTVIRHNADATGSLFFIDHFNRFDFYGSGIFLSSQLFLTSGHAFAEGRANSSTQRLGIGIFSQLADSQKLDSRFQVIESKYYIRWIASQNIDCALIYFENPVVNTQSYPIIDTNTSPAGSYAMIHHAEDGLKKLSVGQASNSSLSTFRSEIAIEGGPAASGAPLIGMNNQLIAIHQSQSKDFTSIRHSIFMREIFEWEISTFGASWIAKEAQLTPDAQALHTELLTKLHARAMWDNYRDDLDALFVRDVWGEVLETKKAAWMTNIGQRQVVLEEGREFLLPQTKDFNDTIVMDALDVTNRLNWADHYAKIWGDTQTTIIENEYVRLDRQPFSKESNVANIQIQINDDYVKPNTPSTVAAVTVSRDFLKMPDKWVDQQKMVINTLAKALRISLFCAYQTRKGYIYYIKWPQGWEIH
jgi:hypothetical protein